MVALSAMVLLLLSSQCRYNSGSGGKDDSGKGT
jgi:hypothetical protein